MSLIHQALKRIQTEQEVGAALPHYGEPGRAQRMASLPVSKGRAVLMFFIFFGVVLLGLWGASSMRIYTNPQSAQISPVIPANGVNESEIVIHDAGVAHAKIEIQKASTEKNVEAVYDEARQRNLHGIELYQQGKFSLAQAEFLASVSMFPEYAEAYNNLGLTYKQLGDSTMAEESYKKALRYKAAYPEAMNNYGVLLDGMGNFHAAISHFKKSIATAPEYPDPYLNMAIAFEKEKKFDEALLYYEKFISKAKKADDPLVRSIRERVLYLNAGRLDVRK